MFEVFVKNKVLKTIDKMPKEQKRRLYLLIESLKESGPIQKSWNNFSQLEENKYHCHLSRKWVACWKWEKDSIIIEVYYAGSRENAPY